MCVRVLFCFPFFIIACLLVKFVLTKLNTAHTHTKMAFKEIENSNRSREVFKEIF